MGFAQSCSLSSGSQPVASLKPGPHIDNERLQTSIIHLVSAYEMISLNTWYTSVTSTFF